MSITDGVSISKYPGQGQVLISDIFLGCPEHTMCKVRPVVIISRKARSGHSVLLAVPLTNTAPIYARHYRHQLGTYSLPPGRMRDKPTWAVCEDFRAVGLNHLYPLRVGGFSCTSYTVQDKDLRAIREGLAMALNSLAYELVVG